MKNKNKIIRVVIGLFFLVSSILYGWFATEPILATANHNIATVVIVLGALGLGYAMKLSISCFEEE